MSFRSRFLYYPKFAIITGGTSVDKLRVLITREQIAAKVAEMGKRITADFAGDSVVLIAVLKGATIFLADLARQIQLDVSFDFIAVSSYGNAKHQSGEVKLMKDLDRSMEGQEHHSGGGHSRHRPDADVPEERAARRIGPRR